MGLIDERLTERDDIRRQRAAELADSVRQFLAEPTHDHETHMAEALAASDRAAAW